MATATIYLACVSQGLAIVNPVDRRYPQGAASSPPSRTSGTTSDSALELNRMCLLTYLR